MSVASLSIYLPEIHFTISLLRLGSMIRLGRFDEAEDEEDFFDAMTRRMTGNLSRWGIGLRQ